MFRKRKSKIIVVPEFEAIGPSLYIRPNDNVRKIYIREPQIFDDIVPFRGYVSEHWNVGPFGGDGFSNNDFFINTFLPVEHKLFVELLDIWRDVKKSHDAIDKKKNALIKKRMEMIKCKKD